MKYQVFSRIGEGSIGGKARGLAFINRIIKNYKLFNKISPMSLLTIPRTVVLSTDIFDEFMDHNNPFIRLRCRTFLTRISLTVSLMLKLPGRVYQDFYAFLAVSRNHPIAVRSSSKLEDSHYQPFAGVYSTLL